jgi:FxsC-like protein
VTPPDLLLPLVWIPIPDGDLSPPIRRRQHAHASLGTGYAARGLRYVVQRGGPEYHDFLTALADHVRTLVRLPVLPPPAALVAPGELPDPFARPVPATGANAVAAPASGPKHVEFVVVAARQLELQTERHAVTAYGAEGDDWCPYLPVVDKRIGLLVQKIALEENLTAGFVPVTQNLISYLQDARAKNTLVVLVVDVWSLRLPSYRLYMNQFDRAERFANAGVLVLWNFADGETLRSKQRLVDSLQTAFPNLTVMKDPQAFHEQLGTPDELVEKLRATLYVLRRRITELGEVMRRAEGSAPIVKPLLIGPGCPGSI